LVFMLSVDSGAGQHVVRSPGSLWTLAAILPFIAGGFTVPGYAARYALPASLKAGS
jgi:hypothetical protein